MTTNLKTGQFVTFKGAEWMVVDTPAHCAPGSVAIYSHTLNKTVIVGASQLAS